MEAGGTQALLMNIYRNIDKSLVQFDFLVEYPNRQFYDDEIETLGGKIYYSNVRKDKNIFKFQKQLKNILAQQHYDIIHVHTYSIGYFVLKTAKRCHVPIRIAHSHSNGVKKDFRVLSKKILQKLYPIYATDYMACSKEAGNYLFKNRQFTVIKNAITLREYRNSRKYRIDKRTQLGINGEFVVGNVGRLEKEKNQLFVLDIFAEIKKVKKKTKLLIVGDGSLKKELLDKADRLNIVDDTIILSNRKDIPKLLSTMDVFILPSSYEGLGIAAIEAQAAGLPVILSDRVSKDAILTNNVTSLSLNDSPRKWAEIALNSKSSDIDYLKKIKEAGYDVESNAKIVQNFYLNRVGK